MQPNLLKTIQNVTLAFHIWLDEKKKTGKKLSCSLQFILDFFFFFNSLSLRFSEAKGKRKTRCNIAAIYLPKRFFGVY